MPEPDFSGLSNASRVLYKPNFDDVQQRARRRRRRQVVAGAVLTVTMAATGTAVAGAASRRPDGQSIGVPDGGVSLPPFIPSMPPTPTVPPSGRYARSSQMVAGDLTHLYLRYNDCQATNCTLMVAATADGGTTWTKSPLPVGHNALAQLIALGPRTLVAWYQNEGASTQPWLATTDGGSSWRPVTVGAVDAIPAGWRALDVPGGPESQVLAADPTTGEIARLAQPRSLTLAKTVAGLPPAAGLWVTGHLGTTTTAPDSNNAQQILPTGSAIEVSHDGGRTWHRQSFPEALDAGDTTLGGAAVATHDGQIAYAVGQAGGELAIYRTGDGGATWQRTSAHLQVGSKRLYAALRADGTLSVQIGDQESDHPTMYQSTDQGQSLREVSIAPGAQAVPVPGGYAESGWPNSSGVWLSTQGSEWSYAAPPSLP